MIKMSPFLRKVFKRIRYLVDSIFLIQGMLLLCNLLLILYLTTLGYHSRLVIGDDYERLLRLRELGLFDAILDSYQSFGGRIFSYVIYYTWLSFLSPSSSLGFYTACLLALYTLAFYRLYQSFFPHFSFGYLLNFAIFTIGGIFYASLNFQVHFWLIGSVFYSLGLAAGILAFAEVFSTSEKWYSYVNLIIAAILSANSLENYSITIFVFLSTYLFYIRFLKKQKISYKWRWFWGIWTISLLILALSPVNFRRLEAHGILSFGDLLYRTRQNIPYFFVEAFPRIEAIFYRLFGIYVYLGTLVATKNSATKFIFNTLTSIVSVFSFIFLGIFLTTLMMGGTVGIDRTLNYLFCALFLCFGYVGFLVGKYSGIHPTIVRFFGILILISYAYQLRFDYINQTYTTAQLAQEYDNRIHYLQEMTQTKNTKTIQFPVYSLRTSRLLFVDLSSIPHENSQYQKVLGLDYEVCVSTNSNP